MEKLTHLAIRQVVLWSCELSLPRKIVQKTLTDAPAYLRLVEANMANFDRVAAWTHEIADRVLDRLPLMKFTPESIAIIGSSDGYLIKRLVQEWRLKIIFWVVFLHQ